MPLSFSLSTSRLAARRPALAAAATAAIALAACSTVTPGPGASSTGQFTAGGTAVTSSSLAGGAGSSTTAPAAPPAPAANPLSPASTVLPVPSALGPAQLGRVRAAAEGFLTGYVPWLYGRTGTAQLRDLTAGLRARLAAGRATVTPAEVATIPKVVSLQVTGPQPGDGLALAYIDDGHGADTAVAFQLVLRGGAWLVDRVFPG